MSNLAENLKRIREDRGISQYKLSEELDIKRSAYGNYETGMSYPEFDVLEKIASYYEIELATLLGDIGDINNEMIKNLNEESLKLKRHINKLFYKKYRNIPDTEVINLLLNKIIEINKQEEK